MSKKTEKKIQEKIIQDKTFGLKNKNKSKVVQQFCKGVSIQVKNKGVSMTLLESQAYEEKKIKKKLEEEQALIQSLYRTVDMVNNVEDDEEEEEQDPKKILCSYHKQGICQKGKKCKFSHDMSLESKAEVLDIYTDQREQMPGNEDDIDNCLNWDDKTLKDVVEANAAKYTSQKPTEIVCKYFLDALEKGKYGWKWVCPNGMNCHYRHCLPQGYVLKRVKNNEKVRDERQMEDIIDEQREQVANQGTKITKEVFLQWKEERAKRKEETRKQEQLSSQNQKKGAKGVNYNLSGRMLFQYDPGVFVDDEEAADEKMYENREEQESDGEEEEQNDFQQVFIDIVVVDQIEEKQEEEEQEDNQFGQQEKVVEVADEQKQENKEEVEQKQKKKKNKKKKGEDKNEDV